MGREWQLLRFSRSVSLVFVLLFAASALASHDVVWADTPVHVDMVGPAVLGVGCLIATTSSSPNTCTPLTTVQIEESFYLEVTSYAGYSGNVSLYLRNSTSNSHFWDLRNAGHIGEVVESYITNAGVVPVIHAAGYYVAGAIISLDSGGTASGETRFWVPEFNVVNHETCLGLSPQHKCLGSTRVFQFPDQDYVYSLINFAGVTSQHSLLWEWIGPSGIPSWVDPSSIPPKGTTYQSSNAEIGSNGSGTYWKAWSSISISDAVHHSVRPLGTGRQ